MIRDRSRSAAASVLPAPGRRLHLDVEAVLETYPGPAVLLDPLGRVVSANATGSALADSLHDGRGEELRAAVSAALADHAAAVREVTLAGGGKDSVALDVSLLPLTAADGAARVLLLGRETTVERGFIDALVESRRLFRDLVNASSDFAWETDPDGKFTFVSTRGAIGYTAQELNGRRAYDLLAEGRAEPEVFPFDSRIPLDDAEVWLAARDGAPACLLVTCVPVTNVSGGFRGARGVAKDVTEARARDAALKRAESRARL
ncbi:MAG: PAS domain-containing protein, partial [Proteobacteria bacterium]|nr:PAS domain-containing protein [Pseudomonadota bacterium]